MQWMKAPAALVALTVVAGHASEVSAQGLFDSLLRQAAPDLKQALQPDAREPAPGDAMPNQLSQGAAGGLQADDGAVALVEDVQGTAAVQVMDYVYQSQQIQLGSKGRLVLSHLDGCLVERVTGGTIQVARGGSQASGGKLQAERPAGCEPAKPIVTADAREAGATVNRATPFEGRDWSEQVSKSARPTFIWPAGGAATLRVLNMDNDPPLVLWQATVQGKHAAYPATAPALAPGVPYRVELAEAGLPLREAGFTVDPDLDLPDTLANRVVSLGR